MIEIPFSELPEGEEVLTNRMMLIDFCREFDLRLVNTFFRKPNTKLVTYREIGVTIDRDVARGNPEGTVMKTKVSQDRVLGRAHEIGGQVDGHQPPRHLGSHPRSSKILTTSSSGTD